MSVSRGGKIVTDGLVLCLDAASKRSYPGAGTTWTDLKGGNDVTLANGPTFDSENGGSIVFDGTNDYAKNNSPSLPTGNVDATICAWFYMKSNTSTWQGIAGWGDRSNGRSALLDTNNARLSFSTWGAPYNNDLISNYTIPLNTWKYVVGSISNKNIKLYQDSINVLDGSINSTPNVTSTKLRLATTDYPGRYHYCNIAMASIYNRELTAEEIKQNYNSTRGRFQ